MLERLYIKNFIIIDELNLEFSPGLNILTGETGAGKSIIAGALSLLLGERADINSIKANETKCIIEGYFRISGNKAAEHLCKENELDDQGELIVRRELSTAGRSRAFVNDTPVSLQFLQQLGSVIVDLHRQFDTLILGNRDFQREVLDALAGHEGLLQEYQKCFYQWKRLKQDCEEKKQQQHQWQKEADYHRFLLEELKEASFKEQELEQAEEELKSLTHAEEIKASLEQVIAELSEGENPIAGRLKHIVHQLSQASVYMAGLAPLAERLRSLQVDLKEMVSDLSGIRDRITYDSSRIEILNERLALGYKLLKKHGVKTTTELLEIQKKLEDTLWETLNLDEEIQRMEKQIHETYEKALRMAHRLTEGRKRQIPGFENKVNQLLTLVGMPDARIKVSLKAAENLQEWGSDEVEFYFNANTGDKDKDNFSSYYPLRKVASGGELSRLMLCIKSLVAEKLDMPVLVFDEVDSGISGEAAKQTGIIMKKLAESRQVICITHQPQIAGKADRHFYVFKEAVSGEIKTRIRLLNVEERVTIIARMLSGDKPTDAALQNAREMINR
ncbi:MAG: DNA repair protein RecN [Chitinophagaceae bacterium]|nr:DNA repair protein RecN [Chitinophagaceae bacterium]